MMRPEQQILTKVAELEQQFCNKYHRSLTQEEMSIIEFLKHYLSEQIEKVNTEDKLSQ